MQEIEKTYLVKTLPPRLAGCRKVEIRDIYTPESAPHPKTRLRKVGDAYEITKKERNYDTASVQDEHTIKLSEEEFSSLTKVQGKQLRKIRFYYEQAGRIGEVDVYLDDFEGLVTADFEFDSRQDLDAFDMPGFCLADVSEEDFIAGGLLAGKKYTDVTDQLKRYGYHRLAIPANLKM